MAKNLKSRLTPALPCLLERGEVILLSQGMHSFGRIWLLFALPGGACIGSYMVLGLLISCLESVSRSSESLWLNTLISVLLLLAHIAFVLWPWLLSGRYWLTTRRLIWRPNVGRAAQLPLDAPEPLAIRAFAWTQTLQVRGERVLRVRFVKGLAQLWGGLLLLQTPGLARALEEPADAAFDVPVALIPHATCTSAPGRGGMLVLTRDFVAFIPATLRDDSAEIFVEAVFSLLPYSAPRAIRPELPLELVLTRLAALPPERFAMHLQYLVTHHDGIYWRNEHTTRVEVRPVGPARALALRFVAGGVTLSVSVAPAQTATLTPTLAAWQGAAQMRQS